MQHVLLEPAADATSSVFTPEPDALHHPSSGAVQRTIAACVEPTVRADARDASESSAISDRFCCAVALSALLALGSAPLLAHGAAIDSMLAVASGVGCFFGGVVLHLVERRRALALLTRSAVARGLDPRGARLEARETLQRWLS